MASHSQARISTFYATAAVALGKAVKIGASGDYIAVGAANTDPCIGIVQNAPDAAGALAEVALPGGGAKALAGEAITKGKLLVCGAAGSLVQANASGDRVIAMAMEDAASGDIFAVEVLVGVATGADV